jgi:uncharacterized repeat protein (TIGR01451 family)
MEFTIEPAADAPLWRRIAPWAAALGLFSGGGYGVYRYAAPAWRNYSAAANAELLAGPDSPVGKPLSTSARSDIKDLFAASAASATPPRDSAATASGEAPAIVATPVAYNRYGSSSPAPQSPPAASPRGVAADDASSRYAASYTSGYGNRYAAPVVSDPAPAAPPSTETKLAEPNSALAVAAQTPLPGGGLAAASSQPPRAVVSPFEPTGGESKANPLRLAEAPAAKQGSIQPTSGESRAAAEDPSLSAARAAFAEAPAKSASDPPAPKLAEPSVATPLSAAAKQSKSRPDASAAYANRAPAPPLEMAAPTGASPAAESSPENSFQSQPLVVDAKPSAAARTRSATPTPGLARADGAGRPGERGLEGVQTPAVTIQKLAPTEIQVGKRCTFAIRVANTGTRAAQQVVVRDEAPLGTQLVGTAPKAAVTGSLVQWDLGTLSPGEERTVEMELIPTDEGELGSVATVNFAAQATARARSTRPELTLRLTSPPRVMRGQTQTVEVEVTNPGTGVATGVMLSESVPKGVSHEAGPSLEFEVGTLQPGETRRLELMLKAEQAGKVSNMMTARADANLEVTAQCEFEVISPALALSVEGPQRRYLERPATYTVSVANPGSAAAKDVQIVTKLPKGLQFVSANNLGEYDAATHSVYWSLAELPSTEKGVVQLTALPVEAGEQTLVVASRAQQGLEESAEARIVVEGLAALSFEVKVADQMVEVGGATSYEIRVTNQGSKAATNVQVAAVLPPGLRATGAGGDVGHAIEGDRVRFAPIAQLAPKSEAKLRVEVQGVRAGDQRLRVEVSSDDVREPIVKQESTRVYADE